jgi:glycosyltransferase involved in cell wall biosynthesis
MNEKISIIIPVYNNEKELGRTLDSVLTQTYQNMEIIIVNDGSKDDTGAVADAYAVIDSRIKVIHKENGGVTTARLRGVAEANGEWIGFVDGDDFIEPQMYARLLENTQAFGADIAHCGYQMVFPNGKVDYYYNTERLVEQDNTRGLYDLIEGDFTEPGLVCKLYRRELFVGLSEWMDTSIRINEDLLMNFYLFRRSRKSVFEDVCPYHYMLRPGSASTSNLNEHKLKDPMKVTRILLEEAPEVVAPAVYRKWVRLLVGGAAMSLGDQKELIAPYRKEMREELRSHLGEILKKSGLKLKIMALWTAMWPWSYGFVHRIYMKATGLDKKYRLE